MTSTRFRIEAPQHFKFGSRKSGISAREYLLEQLKQHDSIEVDFMEHFFSPSFIDSCIGVLCQKLGEDTFRQRVKLVGIQEDLKPLTKLVMVRRLKEREEVNIITSV